MNVAQASIGQYFLLGSGDGFVYEKIGDDGTPEHPRPVVYKYNWNGSYISGMEIDPSVAAHPIELALGDPGVVTKSIGTLMFGSFFLRDTEPDHYYQYFAGEQLGNVVAFRFDRDGGQFLDAVTIPNAELVRPLLETFVIVRKVV